ncbi:hypothetical protein GTP58_18530 [Duganella sp. CY15W]|uniref:tyrosine-type recombinase/integrase n=1 Tax=Duganella sp. CY15W TaxID=2692172 RepID=UPI00136BD6EA|nr:tyrosine-type recombinase/integrase [Duganella sp. CY15W]MYM30332.1 hypothetical protein [Duganella sp. CY15W]
MTLLSKVLAVARKEWKWISESPTTDVARPKAPPARNRLISQVEIEAICVALNWRHDIVGVPPTTKQQCIALAFLFAIQTAMRAGEICGLKKGDVSGRVARLHMTKNGLLRGGPLSARALEIWEMISDGFGVTSAILDAMFRKAREKQASRGWPSTIPRTRQSLGWRKSYTCWTLHEWSDTRISGNCRPTTTRLQPTLHRAYSFAVVTGTFIY